MEKPGMTASILYSAGTLMALAGLGLTIYAFYWFTPAAADGPNAAMTGALFGVIGYTIPVAIAGCLLMAAAKALRLLAEIRDRLPPKA